MAERTDVANFAQHFEHPVNALERDLVAADQDQKLPRLDRRNAANHGRLQKRCAVLGQRPGELFVRPRIDGAAVDVDRCAGRLRRSVLAQVGLADRGRIGQHADHQVGACHGAPGRVEDLANPQPFGFGACPVPQAHFKSVLM